MDSDQFDLLVTSLPKLSRAFENVSTIATREFTVSPAQWKRLEPVLRDLEDAFDQARDDLESLSPEA